MVSPPIQDILGNLKSPNSISQITYRVITYHKNHMKSPVDGGRHT